jgi:hypothetical protein
MMVNPFYSLFDHLIDLSCLSEKFTRTFATHREIEAGGA